ncbi:MAG: hypothetical protein LQ348_002370 [Seirophora lacunosa]|nr:MAG: hypothetical protein LQ348_002370 [Seirophora lacunosa]
MTDTEVPAETIAPTDPIRIEPGSRLTTSNDPAQATPPTESNNTPPSTVTLQVGEKRFQTYRTTLAGSDTLTSMLSDRWRAHQQPDGPYFLDLDPDTFTHVLRFLRTGLYPICYDGAKGHDLAAYAAIAAQAAYLGVPKLYDWVDERRYLKAVTRESSAKIVEGEDGLRGVCGAGTKIRYHPYWKTERNYVCPRGIASHYGSPGKCGRACKQAQGDAEDEYEDCEVLKTLVVAEKMVFDWQVCVDVEG